MKIKLITPILKQCWQLHPCFTAKEHVSVHLVTGLPLEQYTHKKEEFRNMLKSFRVTAYFKGVDLKKVISFDKVTIFPQAAGAVYSSIMDNLTSYLIQGSYLGLIDIGFRTTDIISFMVEDTLILRKIFRLLWTLACQA